MSDNEDLSGAIQALVTRSNTLETAINSARAEVAGANRKIDDLQRTQEKTRTELTGVQTQLGQLREDQQALRQELTKRMQGLESALASNTAVLQAQQAQLASLLSAQREEAARRQLESEQATFLSHVNRLLSRADDGVVRLLIAQRALEACKQRQISGNTFTGLADKSMAEEILSRLATIAEGATDAERAEATWYGKMRALHIELQQRLESYRASTARHEQERAELIAKQQFRQSQIAELKNQTESENKSSGKPWWAPFGSAYRSVASAWHTIWLDRSATQLRDADAEMAGTEQNAREFVRVNGELLRSLTRTPFDIDAGATVASTLETLLRTAADQETRWRTDHGEIRLLGQ